jgi:hypothetical protein
MMQQFKGSLEPPDGQRDFKPGKALLLPLATRACYANGL